jgi:hypothetical protein
MIVTARVSTNPFDFALVAMLGLLGLRIFEACTSDVDDLGEEHGHRVLRVRGNGGKVVLVPLTPGGGQSDRPGHRRPHGQTDPALPRRYPGWTATPQHAGSSTWPAPPECGRPECTHTCSDTFFLLCNRVAIPCASGPVLGWVVQPLAPDRLHKENTSGGAPYGIILPDGCVDGLFAGETTTPFVSYLNRVFEHGGFPWWTGSENEWRIKRDLARDLLPL